MKNRNKFVALIATLALVIPLASCSTNSSQIEANGERSDAQTAMQIDSEVAQSVYPLVVETINGDMSIEDRPTKILSLSPTATEILFAVGAGDQVIAVDDQSNYPAEAPTSGISGYAPNLEAILALEPDLVVHSYLPEDIEQGLANVGIPSLPQFAAQTLEDTYQQIEQLGLVTDNSDSALAQVQSMRDSVDQLVARTSNLDSFSFYHELDQTYYSVTSATFIGQVYDMLGLQNIADAAEGAGSGYPQLSEEYILSQDPDLIFLADTKCCAQSIETVSERNGWNALTAVQSQKIIELDDDIASRWGPRVVEFLEAIVVAIEQIDSEVAQSVYPLVVETINGDMSIEDRPTKILSLSPTATEILFAVGAGDQVIAVDDQSNYPAEAPTSGISGYAPNLEAILALEPDLVVHSYLPEDIEQGLANVGIPSLPQFAAQTLEDTYQQIEQLGLVTDNSDSALAQVQSMRDSVDQLVARTSNLDSFSFYHELDQTYYSVTSATFIGQVYDMLGLQNIADAAEGAGSGYPQLSEEYILSQDPDLIFLADTKCCAQSIETVSERNGWNALTAVQSQKIIELDDDIASRWGPRVVEFLEAIVVAIEQIG